MFGEGWESGLGEWPWSMWRMGFEEEGDVIVCFQISRRSSLGRERRWEYLGSPYDGGLLIASSSADMVSISVANFLLWFKVLGLEGVKRVSWIAAL